MSILAKLLCNQPKACASDLGDDQSCYLLQYIHFACTMYCNLRSYYITAVTLHFSMSKKWGNQNSGAMVTTETPLLT